MDLGIAFHVCSLHAPFREEDMISLAKDPLDVRGGFNSFRTGHFGWKCRDPTV